MQIGQLQLHGAQSARVRARSRSAPNLLIWFLTLQFAVYVMKRKRIISHGQTMQFEVNEF